MMNRYLVFYEWSSTETGDREVQAFTAEDAATMVRIRFPGVRITAVDPIEPIQTADVPPLTTRGTE